LAADVVGVALDLDEDVLVLALHPVRERVEGGLCLVGKVVLVEAKLHVVVGQGDLIEELALGQLASLLGAGERVAGGVRQLVDLALELGVRRLQLADLGLVLLDLALHLTDLRVGRGLGGLNLFLDIGLCGAAGHGETSSKQDNQRRGKELPHSPPPRFVGPHRVFDALVHRGRTIA